MCVCVCFCVCLSFAISAMIYMIHVPDSGAVTVSFVSLFTRDFIIFIWTPLFSFAAAAAQRRPVSISFFCHSTITCVIKNTESEVDGANRMGAMGFLAHIPWNKWIFHFENAYKPTILISWTQLVRVFFSSLFHHFKAHPHTHAYTRAWKYCFFFLHASNWMRVWK